MFRIRWMSLDGAFRTVAETSADTFAAAQDLLREIYPEAKFISDDDGYSFRVTAKSLGGRPGRNVAYIEDNQDFS